MAQQYDRIIKENIQDILLEFLKETTNLQFSKYEVIYPEFPVTIKRIADFVVKAKSSSQEEEIIHIEFQSSNDNNMVSRMLIYYGLLLEIYQIPIRQFVFYYGKEKLKMDWELKHKNLHFKYEMIDLQSVSYKKFIDSEKPEMVLFSILTDFEDKDAGWIIQKIITRIKNLDTNTADFNKHFIQLDSLSVLRNLQETVIKKQEDMALILDIKKDLRFKEGKEEGIEKGKEEVAKNLYAKSYSIELISEVTKLSMDYLKKLLNINS